MFIRITLKVLFYGILKCVYVYNNSQMYSEKILDNQYLN